MDVNKAEKLARELINIHCPSYNFKFNNRKRSLGICNYSKRSIQLSKVFTELNPVEIVTNTILHEIAHALTPGHSHDIIWKKKAIELGSSGVRKASKEVISPKGKYSYACPNCGLIYYKHRKVKREGACAICCKKYSNNKYSEKFRLEFKGETKMNKSIDDKVDKTPACVKGGHVLSYTIIGGQSCKESVCYKSFKAEENCPYLLVKNGKQYCRVDEK